MFSEEEKSGISEHVEKTTCTCTCKLYSFSVYHLIFQRLKVHNKLRKQSIGGSSTAAPGDTGFTAAAIAAAKRQSSG